MRRVVLRIIPLLCLAGLFSCEDGPVSDENWTPEIVSVESQPSVNSARLKATLSSELQAVCEYGFYYGSDKESLEKVTNRVEFVTFDEAKLSGVYVRYPERSELNAEINESLIVEFYSRV